MPPTKPTKPSQTNSIRHLAYTNNMSIPSGLSPKKRSQTCGMRGYGTVELLLERQAKFLATCKPSASATASSSSAPQQHSTPCTEDVPMDFTDQDQSQFVFNDGDEIHTEELDSHDPGFSALPSIKHPDSSPS